MASSSQKHVDAARKFLWEEDEAEPPIPGGVVGGVDTSASGRVFAGGRTDPHVDQSMNLHDANIGDTNIGDHPRPSNSGGGGVMDRVSGLFRASQTAIPKFVHDEYGDASPSTESEEYLFTDKRRMSPVVAAFCSTLNNIGFGKIACILLSIGVVFFIFGGGLHGLGGAGGSPSRLQPRNERHKDILQRIVDSKITDEVRLDNPTSSPSKALEWIVFQDPANLPVDHEDLLERYVLATLYYETNGHLDMDEENEGANSGDGWKRNDNWLSGKGICIWYGVKCVPKAGEGSNGSGVGEKGLIDIYDDNAPVLSIELVDNNISGKIPSELSGLVSLVTLDLSENKLTGQIPTEIGKMFAVRSLSLRKNSLSGKIPTELSQLSGTLHALNLGQNSLSGNLPTEIGLMEKLRDFSIAENDIKGPIPTEFGDLTKLTIFYADKNKLTGTIPDSINEWKSVGKSWCIMFALLYLFRSVLSCV